MFTSDEGGDRCQTILNDYIAGLGSVGEGGMGVELIHGFRCGSAAHNLVNESSDEDYQGVFGNCVGRMCRVTATKDSFQVHDPYDICLYEVGTFIGLLFKGNPKVIEALLTERLTCFSKPFWHGLVALHAELLNQVTYSQYKSYAGSRVSVARKAENGSRKKFKMYAHALRLFHEAGKIVKGVRPDVWLEGEFRETLMNIRAGEIEEEEVDKIVVEAENELNFMEKTYLPQLRKTADPAPFEKLLAAYRVEVLSTAEPPCKITRDEINIPHPPPIPSAGVLSLTPPGPEGISVGIFAAPTVVAFGHIPKVSPEEDLPSCVVLSAEDGVVLRTYNFIDRNYSKPKAGEIVFYEVSAALGLLERGNIYLLRGLYEGQLSTAWKEFVSCNIEKLYSKATLQALHGQLRGLIQTESPALPWAHSFITSITDGNFVSPSFTTPPPTPPADLIEAGVPPTTPLPPKTDSAPFDAWLHSVRVAML